MKWSTRSSQIKRKKESQKPEEKIKGQEPIKENEEKNQTLQWHSSKSLRWDAEMDQQSIGVFSNHRQNTQVLRVRQNKHWSCR